MRKAEFALRPAPQETIMKAFVFLGALCAMKNETKAANQKEQAAIDQQRKLKYTAMINALMEYPGDLVLDAIKQWPKHNTWFPEASQIMQLVEKETQSRKSLVTAIKNAPDKPPEKPKGRKWHELSDDEKAAHEQKMHEAKQRLKKVSVDANFIIGT